MRYLCGLTTNFGTALTATTCRRELPAISIARGATITCSLVPHAHILANFGEAIRLGKSEGVPEQIK